MIRTLLQNLEAQLQRGIYAPPTKTEIARRAVKIMQRDREQFVRWMRLQWALESVRRGIYE